MWARNRRGRLSRRPKTMGTTVTRLQRQVALLKPEAKSYFGTVSISNVTQAAGSITAISLIPQGTSDQQRIGDSVRGISMQIRGQVSNAASQFTNFRVMIVKDGNSNGQLPSIAGGTQSIFNTFIARSTYQQPSTRKRFKVLFDKYFSTNSIQYGANRSGYVDGKFSTPYLTEFVSNSGVQADAGKNQYYLVILVDDADVGDFNFGTEFRFSDV